MTNELKAFHRYFVDRCEMLFCYFGMEAVDLYNAAAEAEYAALASSPVGPAEPTALRNALRLARPYVAEACKGERPHSATFHDDPYYISGEEEAWIDASIRLEKIDAALAAPVGPETDAPDVLREMAQFVFDKFSQDLAAGYITRDKEFAVSLLGKGLASPPVLGTPPIDDLALRFHEAYERLAPSFGYETRPETRAFDPESKNGRLMVAVCAELLGRKS